METDKCCVVNENAKNPAGQRHTMAGTTGCFVPPNAGMHSTVNMQVDPTSSMGVKRVEK